MHDALSPADSACVCEGAFVWEILWVIFFSWQPVACAYCDVCVSETKTKVKWESKQSKENKLYGFFLYASH